jgi:hypothetical protein
MMLPMRISPSVADASGACCAGAGVDISVDASNVTTRRDIASLVSVVVCINIT